LEIGAGAGDTLCRIKELNLASEVVGFELFELPDSNQKNPLIDSIFFGDIEYATLPFDDKYFDVIIFGDVLEHLVNPWDVIDKQKKLLKDGGTIIVSLPNIRYFKAMYKVFFQGSFRYEERGIFDKTHLRFFCKKDMLELMENNKLKLVKVYPSFKIRSNARKIKILNFITLGLLSEFLASQYIIIVQKPFLQN